MMVEEETYLAEMEQMRRERTAALVADRSWLTLAGLYWLQPGENSFGTAPTNALLLPGQQGPAHAGTFTFTNGTTTLHGEPGVMLQVNGNVVGESVLQDDMSGSPDLVTLGNFSMILIKRGERYGIRLYDTNSPIRQAFIGLDWYPVDPTYRIEAAFIPYEPARLIAYGNVLGDTIEEECPGAVEFTWQGVRCRLDALARGDKFFFNFHDATNGATTYGAGRFLYTEGVQYAEAGKAGTVIVDFNQTTNPYCAYTAYATCPLPPSQNCLPVRIEAGERKFPQSIAPVH